MKFRIKHLLPLLAFVLIVWACEKDDDEPGNGEVDYGIQYFECDLNGIPFDTFGSSQCSQFKFFYYPEKHANQTEGYCNIGGKNCVTDETVTIRINNLADSIGNLDFLEPTFADSCFPYYGIYIEDSLKLFVHERLVDGKMNIEHFIPRKDNNSPLGSIKGTFEFTVTDELGLDTMRITNGRFRFDVPQIF